MPGKGHVIVNRFAKLYYNALIDILNCSYLTNYVDGGPYWTRTSDLFHVKEML